MDNMENAFEKLKCAKEIVDDVSKDCFGFENFQRLQCACGYIGETINMLKAQEPRVMTLIEVMAHDNRDGCIWYETIGISPAFVFCEGYRKQSGIIEILSPYFLQKPQYHCFKRKEEYGKTWRCWTSRPTDEQRKVVKWE